MPESDPMKPNRIRITRPDGTTYEIAGHDRIALKLIREKPNLTEFERAMLHIACPTCNARAGRICRNHAGRRTEHHARIVAYYDLRSPTSRQQSPRLES